MPRNQAIQLAKDRGLDLVEVNRNHDPPVCKIFDFGKYKYNKQKQQKAAKKKQTTIQTKELKFRPEISEHDYNVKVKHAREFLTTNKKVKLTLKFRGRQIIYADRGRDLLNRIADDLKDISVCDKKPSRMGKIMTLTLSPRKGNKQKGGNIAENKDQ